MTYLLLSVATLITSLISGVLSMAGGTILMAVFSVFLSVPAAMVLHGVAQAVSNGSRVWIYREHIRWNVLMFYFPGALLVLAIFMTITVIPNKGIIFIIIGLFPFIAFIMPKRINLDIEQKPIAFLSGLLVMTAQMLAGASGPVLDIFYVQSALSRQEILATKAITQTLGHLIKLSYYAFFVSMAMGFDIEVPLWIFPIVVFCAIFGNWAASWVVHRMSDQRFKQIGRIAIMIVGIACIVKGVQELGMFT